jgi:hypothetical protein
LTDKFFKTLIEVAAPGGKTFPLADFRAYEASVAAGGQKKFDRGWVNHWNWGFARAPVELIAYIVEEDRNYQEVVTADYMMVNYITNDLLKGGASFDTENPSVFKPGQNNGQIIYDDQLTYEYTNLYGTNLLSHGPFLDYPAAGVLNSHAFLNRYPTTETNRNRARARWTYFHFLGVDIEKSAKRTIDPVALADTNNPTMNNPACVVCHAIHDPVAGAFQNYGDSGRYRDQYPGTDALPKSYKKPGSEYTQGDTWYRDMRTAGFEGKIAPNPDNSMQWLGSVIASEGRFGTAAVKFWWPSLMGAPVLEAPDASEDSDFAVRLAAFEAQNSFIEKLGAEFAAGIEGGAAYNGKDLLASMVLGEWFRADEVENVDVRNRLVNELGTRRLLTPEELEKKSLSLLGWRWGGLEGGRTDPYLFDGRYTHLDDFYNIYYGGIDFDGIVDRSSALTALMVNVAEKQALEMACPAVMVDFDKADSTRLLFNGIDANTTPVTEIRREFAVDAASVSTAETYSLRGNFTQGEKIVTLSFTNDSSWEEINQAGFGDRNLHLIELTITDGTGNTVLFLGFKDIDSIAGATHDCAAGDSRNGPGRSGFELWSNCTVSIPFSPALDSDYTITVLAYGDQGGPDAVELVVNLNGVNPEAGGSIGARAIKAVIVNLHNRLLGRSRDVTDAEIDMTYQLLVDSWQARKIWMTEKNDTNGTHSPEEFCLFYLDEHREEGGIFQRQSDPSGMKSSWQSVLAYLMTDFDYLHE